MFGFCYGLLCFENGTANRALAALRKAGMGAVCRNCGDCFRRMFGLWDSFLRLEDLSADRALASLGEAGVGAVGLYRRENCDGMVCFGDGLGIAVIAVDAGVFALSLP